MHARPIVVAFDVIETVFALTPVRERFAEVGLPREALGLWFAQVLRDAFALAATDAYSPFREVAGAALESLLAEHQLPRTRERVDHVLSAFAELPAHEDAEAAMRTLSDCRIRMIALTNGAAKVTEALLARSKLTSWIEHVVSVDEIRCWKPRSEVYRHAAGRAGVEPSQLALIAAHAWDVHGAKRAGLIGGYVARGKPFPHTMSSPDVTGATLLEVASALAARPPLGRG